jgi:hypothetical protein
MKNRANLWLGILGASTAGALGVAVFLATLGTAAGGGKRRRKRCHSGRDSSLLVSASTVAYADLRRDGDLLALRGQARSIQFQKCQRLRICVHDGASFALIDGNDVYLLEGNWEQVKKAAGQRAEITGTLRGHTIEVSSVTAP